MVSLLSKEFLNMGRNGSFEMRHNLLTKMIHIYEKIMIISLLLLIFMGMLSIDNKYVYAEAFFVEADGSYLVGNGPEENINVAKKEQS